MGSMQLKVAQELSEPGGQVNEDLIWHGGNDFMVLDGASSLTPGSHHDAVGFVRAFTESYAVCARADKPLHTCVNESLDTLRERFDPARYEQGIGPSASLAVVRCHNGWMELLLLGDCTALILSTDGRTERTYLNEVARFDAIALDMAARIHEETGLPIRETIHNPLVHEQLVANRHMMNQPAGYRILSATTKPLTSTDVMSISLDGLAGIILHSDGFDNMEDDLTRQPIDLGRSYRMLRELERIDADLNRYPRFKIGDDATALYLEVVPA